MEDFQMGKSKKLLIGDNKKSYFLNKDGSKSKNMKAREKKAAKNRAPDSRPAY